MRIRIELDEAPISTQHVYGNRAFGKRVIRYLTTKGKEYKGKITTKAIIAAKKAGLIYPWDVDVSMKIQLKFKDKRRRDIDNYNKLLLDALEGVIYVDDKQICDLEISKASDCIEDNVIIEVEPMKEIKEIFKEGRKDE